MVFEKIAKYIHDWANVKSGIYSCENGTIDEDKLQQLREERLSFLLTQNIKQEEKH